MDLHWKLPINSKMVVSLFNAQSLQLTHEHQSVRNLRSLLNGVIQNEQRSHSKSFRNDGRDGSASAIFLPYKSFFPLFTNSMLCQMSQLEPRCRTLKTILCCCKKNSHWLTTVCMFSYLCQEVTAKTVIRSSTDSMTNANCYECCEFKRPLFNSCCVEKR